MADIMATSTSNAVHSDEGIPPVAQTLEIDGQTLRARADDYKKEGDEEFQNEEYYCAIDCYTEGIKVSCKDEKINAILFTNRATAHFHLGGYHEALIDAKTARQFQPTYMKAIERGASTCVELERFDEAIEWCDEGLAIDKENKMLLELRNMAIKKQITCTEKAEVNSETGTTDDKEASTGENKQEVREKATGGHAYRSLGIAYYSGGDFEKALDYHHLDLSIAKEVGDKVLEGGACGNLGVAYNCLGDFKRALEYHQLHLSISQDVGDRDGEGIACGNLGFTYRNLGDFRKSLEFHLKRLSITKELEDREGEGMACCYVGSAYQSLGDYKQALEYHKLHHSISQEVGSKAGQGAASGNIGLAYYSLGDFKKAMEYHQIRLNIAKETGNKAAEGRSYANLGLAFNSLGDFKKALEYHHLHLSITKDLRDRPGEGKAYGNLGLAHHSLGDFEKALQYYQLQLSIGKDLGDKAAEGKAYGGLGLTYDSLGDFKKALEYHLLHLNITKEVGDRAEEGRTCCNLGITYRNLSDFPKALEYQHQGLTIAKDVGDRHGEGTAYANLGLVHHSLGNFRKALEYHLLHLSITKDIGDRAGEGKACSNIGNDYFSFGDFRKALEYHKLHLSIAREVGDISGEAKTCGNIGSTYHSLGDFRKALEYHQLDVNIAKEIGDRAGEGNGYGNLGLAYHSLGDFNKALDYHQLGLSIAKEVQDRAEEGKACSRIGLAYYSLGDFNKALKNYQLALSIAKEIGDRSGEGKACCNVGLAYWSLGDFENALEHHQLNLSIAKEAGDRSGEAKANCNLGLTYWSLGDFTKALDYHQLHLRITKEVEDRAGEGRAYANIGIVYSSLGVFEKAIEYHQLHLKIAKDVGDAAGEGKAYANLGFAYRSVGDLDKAAECYKSSVTVRDKLRDLLLLKDDCKISLRNHYKEAYTALWMVQLKQKKNTEALLTAEQGRGQALMDLMELQYSLKSAQLTQSQSGMQMEMLLDISNHISTPTIFLAVAPDSINFWVLEKGKELHFVQKQIDEELQSLIDKAYQQIGVLKTIRSENRNLDEPTDEELVDQKPVDKVVSSSDYETDALKALYSIVIKPIAHLVHGSELTIVPDGPLLLVPFAALVDQSSRHVSETFSVRLIPSLTSLKLMRECPEGHHSKAGALLVGDPWVGDVRIKKKKVKQLPCAKREVEMIGQILKCEPLTGKRATKGEVLSRLNAVAVVHIAAHGSSETGEIVLSPNPTGSKRPKEEDFLLTMGEVLNANLQAKLVVLSCCHSGRGEIKAEGVVGIARAFLGAGARSVLVSLWAINDEATLEFMRKFYENLVEGQSASKSLNQAMRCMRESDNFSDVRHWAAFVLIGDDVTLQFGQISNLST